MVCPNCNFTETLDATFCSKCGQKFGPYKVTIKEFLHDLVDHVFALETTFFRTLRKIFIPGQLTIDYFSGLRKRYYHPLRLFFVLLVIHLGTVSGLIPYEKLFEEINGKTTKIIAKEEIRKDLEAKMEKRKDQASLMARDSIYEWLELRRTLDNSDTLTIRSTGIFDFNIPQEDLLTLSIDSLSSKYAIKDYWTRLILAQVQKFSIDPKGMIKYIIGNASWMMIILIPILALVLKMFFRNKKRYFIEHLFYLYHWHAAAFLAGTILFLFFKNHLETIWPTFITLVIIFGVIAWKRVYAQGWIRSIIKFMSMGFIYIILFLVLASITAVISFSFY